MHSLTGHLTLFVLNRFNWWEDLIKERAHAHTDCWYVRFVLCQSQHVCV
jgi:hypothetical protein